MAKLETSAGRLYTDRQVAEKLNVSLGTIRRWRLLEQGPKFIRLGSLVRYRDDDLAEWLKTRPSGGERHGGEV
jgi:excisionase family DNA binding protein